MSLEAVATYLNGVVDQLERLWIERDVFGETLHKNGFTPAQIKKLSDDARADPVRQKRAAAAYAEMRSNLLEAGKRALIEALSKEPPKSGEVH